MPGVNANFSRKKFACPAFAAPVAKRFQKKAAGSIYALSEDIATIPALYIGATSPIF
jgi:hypothetical protein